MNTRRLATALALALLMSSPVALAHRSSPASVNDPAADATDLYAWVQGTNLVIVADFIGLEAPEGGPNWARFDDDVLYEIHIARGGTSLSDALTYQFRFKTQPPKYVPPLQQPLPVYPNTGGTEVFSSLTASGAFAQSYSVTKLENGSHPTPLAQNIRVAPPNVGAMTNTFVYMLPNGSAYESTFGDPGNAAGTVATLMPGQGRVFAGPRDDPFFADEGAINDLLHFRPAPSSGQTPRDSYAYTNVHAIVLEIPLTLANGGTAVTASPGQVSQTVGIWASTSRRTATLHRRGGDHAIGPWRQVSRVGLPLFAKWLIGVQDRDLWSRSRPTADMAQFAMYLLNPILVRDAVAVGLYSTQPMMKGLFADCSTNGGTDLQSNRMDIIGFYNLGNSGIRTVGDVLRVDLAGPSGFPNGRLLTDNVVDLTARLLLCGVAKFNTVSAIPGPSSNEPEAPLPKGGAASPVFPYLQTPWEGLSANPRPAPLLP